MEEHFPLRFWLSSLTAMCTDTNGTTARQLLCMPASLTHLFIYLFFLVFETRRRFINIPLLCLSKTVWLAALGTVGGKGGLALSSQATDCPTFNYC